MKRQEASRLAGALAQKPQGLQRVSPGVYRDASGNLVRGRGNSSQPAAPQRPSPSSVVQGAIQGVAQGAGAALGGRPAMQPAMSDKMYRFPQGGGMAEGIAVGAMPQGGGYGNPMQSAMQGAAYGAQFGGQMQGGNKPMPFSPQAQGGGPVPEGLNPDLYRTTQMAQQAMQQFGGQPQGGGMMPYDQQMAAQQAAFGAAQGMAPQGGGMDQMRRTQVMPQGGGYKQMPQQAIQGAMQGVAQNMNPMMRKF